MSHELQKLKLACFANPILSVSLSLSKAEWKTTNALNLLMLSFDKLRMTERKIKNSRNLESDTTKK